MRGACVCERLKGGTIGHSSRRCSRRQKRSGLRTLIITGSSTGLFVSHIIRYSIWSSNFLSLRKYSLGPDILDEAAISFSREMLSLPSSLLRSDSTGAVWALVNIRVSSYMHCPIIMATEPGISLAISAQRPRGSNTSIASSPKAAVSLPQRDPLLLDVARHYLGSEAKLITTRTWWSFPAKSASEADLSRASFKFHFDLDDWRMLKFFFYLSDVDADAGPRVYVRGSHNRRRLEHQLTLLVGHPADEVLSFYGEDSAITLTGKAGTGFVEDAFGFHRGTLANSLRA
jgi:hypothetical protein